MSIAARCEDCQKLYKVDEKLAGKRVRCKACGGAVMVPQSAAPIAARPASARASAAAAPRKQAARPSQRVEDDDPFSNLDALMSLEGNGTVTDEPPPLPAPKPSRVRAEPVDDGVLAPAAYAPRPTVRGPGQGPPRINYGRANRPDAYITLPNEDAIDGFVPMASIGIFAVFLVITFIRTMSAASAAPPDVAAKAAGFAFGILLGAYAILLAVIFGILAPLSMLGVFIASKIMNFERPGSFYLRCAAVICAPISLGIVVNGFGFADPTALSWMVTFPVMLGVLWLMFRLKPLPYLVTVAFNLICVVGIPLLIVMTLFAGLGLSLGGLGMARARGLEVKSAANLRQIGQAMRIYANENKGRYPDSLNVVARTTDIDQAALKSPLGSKPYVYAAFPGISQIVDADYAVVWDPNKSASGSIEVLYFDGHVEPLTEAQWQAAQRRNEEIRRRMQERRNPQSPGRELPNPSTITPPRTFVPDRPPAVVKPVDFAAHHATVEAAMNKIAAALKTYSDAHNGDYPASVFELRNAGIPINDLRSPFGWQYVYSPPRRMKSPLPGRMVLLHEEGVRDKKRTVIWGDLRVETIDIDNWDQIVSESNKLRNQR